MRPSKVLHDDTVTIVKVTESTGEGEGEGDDVDADGVPITTTTSHTWAGVNVQATGTTEWDDSRHTVVTTYRVSGGIPAVLPEEGDTITWRGRDHQVVGDPDVRTGAHRINHCSLLMRDGKG